MKEAVLLLDASRGGSKKKELAVKICKKCGAVMEKRKPTPYSSHWACSTKDCPNNR